jgi:hypothetical protein
MANVYKQGIGRLAYKLQAGGTIPGDTLPSILDEQLANKFVGAEPDVVVERTPKTGDVDALIRKYVPPHLREAFGRAPATRFIPPEMRRRGRDLRDALTVENTVDAGLAAAEFTDYGDLKLMQGGVDKMFGTPGWGTVEGVGDAISGGLGLMFPIAAAGIKNVGGKVIDSIRPAKENLQTVLDSNFYAGRVVGDELVPIASLNGGTIRSADEIKRVDELAKSIDGPDGYIERLIVDYDGNVVEGQHRLDALRKLGVDSVPITRVADDFDGLDVPALRDVVRSAGIKGTDQGFYVIKDAAKMLREEGSVAAVVDAYEDLHPAFRSAMEAIEAQRLPMDTASRMKRAEEMGFNRDVYHASMQDISEFDPAMGYGDGLISTTPDTEFANNWLGLGKHQQRIGAEAEAELADAMAKERALKKEIFDYENLNKLKGDEFSRAYDAAEERFKRLRGPIRAKDIHRTVYPLKTSVQNPFNPDKHFDELDDFFTKNNTSESDKDLFRTGNWLMYENTAMKKYLEGKGFDAMELRESTGGPITTLSVFDPSNLRSRFAKFDPAKKDLPGLGMRDGGVVRGPRSVPRETRPTVFSTGIPTALRRVR